MPLQTVRYIQFSAFLFEKNYSMTTLPVNWNFLCRSREEEFIWPKGLCAVKQDMGVFFTYYILGSFLLDRKRRIVFQLGDVLSKWVA